MLTLAIDPGNSTGWALYRAQELLECGITEVDRTGCRALALLATQGIGKLVVECPQVYRQSQSKGDPNDLIKVAVMVGQWVERGVITGAHITTVLPHSWKGTIPKHIHHARIWDKLTPEEQGRIPDIHTKRREDMMDAVALGLWHVGRVRVGGC